jgi:hypothetical protein
MAKTFSGADEDQNAVGGSHNVFSSDGPVSVPDTAYITNSEMVRDGQDLVLTTEDGQVVIEGYFIAQPPPQIISPQGAVLSPDMVNSFVQSPAQYAQKASMTDASPVGSVQEVSGDATITRTDGSTENIRIGTPVYQGDIVETEGEGAVNIVFIDETSFAVSENARLAIDEYVFDPATESGSTNFSVLRGVFVFTSGLIGRDDPDDVEIDTPVGSIGIRGTIIAGDVDAGEFTVVEGAIVLRSHNGEEMTLADQFATARFDSDTGSIQSMGQLTAGDVGARFASISKVAPAFHSSLGEGGNGEAPQEGAGEQEEAQPSEDETVQEEPVSEETTEEASSEETTEEATEETTEEASSEETTEEATEETTEEATEETSTEEATIETTTTETTTTDTSVPPPTTTTTTSTDSYSTSTSTDTSTTDSTTDSTDTSSTDSSTTDTSDDTTTATTTTTTNTAPPPFEVNIIKYGLDDIPDFGDVVATIDVTYPGYYEQVGYTLDRADSIFALDQVDSNTAVIRYVGGEDRYTVGEIFDFTVKATSEYGDSLQKSFGIEVQDYDNPDGPELIDLNHLDSTASVVKHDYSNSNNFNNIKVAALGDGDGDGTPEYGVFGYDGDLNYKIYEGGSLTPDWEGTYGIGSDYSEFDVASIGDTDGDGKDDYIVGARMAATYGEVSIYGGDGTQVTDTGPAANYGTSVAGLGDINNDGYEDFAISSISGVTGDGEVNIYLGGDASISAFDIANYSYQIDGTTIGFGTEVHKAGYYNSDSYGDIIVGSPGEYAAYIYSGEGPSYNQLAKISGAGIGTGDNQFGHAVMGGFDLNGDGLDDVAIGGGNDGYIVYGGNGVTDVASLDGSNGFKLVGDAAKIVGGGYAGDFNADGYDDVAFVSTYFNDADYINDIFVMYGGTNVATDLGSGGSVNISSLDASNINASDYAFQIIWDGPNINGENIEVSSAGDIDGDGFDDLVIGSSDTDEVFIVHGRPTYGALDSSDPDMHAAGLNHDPNMDIIASSSGDSLVGGSGNIYIKDGGYGNLSMRGGAGNDTLFVSAERIDTTVSDNHRTLDGGAGVYDTLRIVGGGSIDFSGVLELDGIERIDMLNSYINTLTLDANDIFDMAGDRHALVAGAKEMYVLTIDGDADDTVDLTAAGFTAKASYDEAGYAAYTNAAETHVLLIDTDITSISF